MNVAAWGNRICCRIDDGTNKKDVLSPVNSAWSWTILHGLLLVDHTRYAQCYANGAGGGATDISSVGDFSSSLPFMLFARGSCGYIWDWSTAVLHVLQIWPFTDIGSHSADDVARERAAIAMGQQALHSHGALTPLTL